MTWYAIRTRSGFQRLAAADQALPKHLHNEFVIERQGRNKGYDIFTPSFWIGVLHHRKKVWITKRFPLFVGYSFVQLHDSEFERLRNDVEGVLFVLRDHYGPAVFSDDYISRLVFNDWQEWQDILFAEHSKAELVRQHEIVRIKAKLKKIMPRGRSIRVSLVEEAEKKIESLPPKTKAFALDLLKRLDELSGEGVEKAIEHV